MSVSPSPGLRSVIVSRLRAAGCVFAEDEARLLIAEARTPSDLAAMVDQRAAGLPLEYVLGWAEFCGLRIAVDAGVFVPRRRTEFLVREAAALVREAAYSAGQVVASPAPQAAATVPQAAAITVPQTAITVPQTVSAASQALARPRTVILDLCCGSGAVGAALAAVLEGAELHAADIDPAAVRCTRRNVTNAGGQVYEGDLYVPLPASLRGRVDVLVANAPYVPTQAIGLLPPEARIYEPSVTLDGGADGLDVVRRVIAGAPPWLVPGGHLLVETSERQAPHAVEAVAGSGLIPRVVSSDELNATVVVGTRPAEPSTTGSLPPAGHP